MMKLHIDQDWLRKKIEEEGDHEIGAGGVVFADFVASGPGETRSISVRISIKDFPQVELVDLPLSMIAGE